MINTSEYISGWRIHIDEIANNAYSVTLMDSSGRQAGSIDCDLDRAISTALSFVFDIEKQISGDLGVLSFEMIRFLLLTSENAFHEESHKDSRIRFIGIADKYIKLEIQSSTLISAYSKSESTLVKELSIKSEDLLFEDVLYLTEWISENRQFIVTEPKL
jgi:hypothetical protein